MKILMDLHHRAPFPSDGSLTFALALHSFRIEAAEEWANRKREREYEKQNAPSPSRGIPA